jgi:hypothetical protein
MRSGSGFRIDKSFADSLANQIQLRLQRIDELMQSLVDDGFDVAKREFRSQSAQSLLSHIDESSRYGTGNCVQRIVSFCKTKSNRSRKLVVKDQELDDPLDRDAVIP